MWDGGVYGVLSAGYGSNYDDDMFGILICDDCITANKDRLLWEEDEEEIEDEKEDVLNRYIPNLCGPVKRGECEGYVTGRIDIWGGDPYLETNLPLIKADETLNEFLYFLEEIQTSLLLTFNQLYAVFKIITGKKLSFFYDADEQEYNKE
jgi:hypothetical protein